ncbi:helix-turn-helix domain-containing protein [Streptomyces sp. NPDC002055]|uniref:helix-turn-helix domain-containing protein n=1 Tax=Streptomyces sp. NPDC002055 TaxID=3154534 RepID=UPI00331F6B2D
MYEERFSRTAGATLWTRTADGTPQRVLPDGCTDLIVIGGELVVAGPDTRAHLATGLPGTRYLGLRFPPGRGPALLGVPADELRDRRVPLGALWSGREARVLAEQVVEADDPAEVLARIAADRQRTSPPPDPLVTALVPALRAGEPVAAVAAAAGLGERQLRRRCLTAFGYGPKTLARVLRMNRALRLARDGVPYATVAAATGYADQAHLAREVKALAGVPLSELPVR